MKDLVFPWVSVSCWQTNLGKREKNNLKKEDPEREVSDLRVSLGQSWPCSGLPKAAHTFSSER